MANLADLLFRTVDGVFAVNGQQKISFWNPGCAQLFGTPTNEALGRPCYEVVRGKDPKGQPFCGEGCCMTRLSHDQNIQESFPLRICKDNEDELRFSVNIVLVPSRYKDRWTCVHLLRRGENIDTLDVLEYNTTRHRTGRNRNIKNNHHSSADADLSLTAREYEVLQLLSEGLAVSIISDLLNISKVTVRNHLQHIQAKLGVHSQVETVAYAYRHNLVHY